MESFCKTGLQEAEVFIPPQYPCTFEGEDMSQSSKERIYNQRYAQCHSIDTMSNGSISPDLGDMWHHGYPVSPQWEGRLELDSQVTVTTRSALLQHKTMPRRVAQRTESML